MGILFKNKSYLVAAAAALAVCVMMIAFSDIAVMSAKKGISLWASSVLPAMLPFFICVNFMTGIGLVSLLPAGIFPFAMSALSGYPMGAKVAGDLFRNGAIDIQETRRIMSYCSTSGPVFMVGAVGVGMLGSQAAGYIIAMAHYAGALINGIVYSRILRNGSKMSSLHEQRIEDCDLMEILTVSIFSAFKSMAVILAYVIFFMFVMDMADMAGLFGFTDSTALRGLLKGIVEMTMGCSGLTGDECGIKTDCILCSIIISWGGLSVLGQSMSMLTGTGISLKYLMLTKLTHSIFAGIISLFLVNVML